MALAGQLGYNICVLNLAERGLTDDRLALALSAIPPQVCACVRECISQVLSTSLCERESGYGNMGCERESVGVRCVRESVWV